jgi:predicted transcriptional regulator
MENDLLSYVTQIVSAHVAHNSITPDQLPALIQSVHHTLSTLDQPAVEVPVQAPAVSIKKSVFDDYIVCLEDGKKLKMLKRHLQTSYQMTPEQYRAKWGLPSSYPMVAPNYAARRSELAKNIGLGRLPKVQPAPSPVVELKVRKTRKAA